MPCLVLGLETQIGLGIVRELGRAGVTVVGIARNPRALALGSRFLADRIVVEGRSDQAIEDIRRIGSRYGGGVLIAISDVDLAWLEQHREKLFPIIPILPPKMAFEAALDKKRTIAIAQELGIKVPQTTEVNASADIDGVVESQQFPVVLKWQDPQAINPLLQSFGIELIKAEYVYDKRALDEALRRYQPIDRWPLIQQYCPGYGMGQFFYIHEGKAIRRFQHRRVCEWPPEGGFSAVCEAVPLDQHVELQAKSIALLNHLGWEGVAMVEYRYDPEQRQAVLMEVNGRYWGSFPLAVQSRAGFALISYLLHTTGELPELPDPLQHIRSRNLVNDLKHLVCVMFQKRKIHDRRFRVEPGKELGRFLFDFVRSNTRYFVWSSDDPEPFFRDVGNSILSLAVRTLHW